MSFKDFTFDTPDADLFADTGPQQNAREKLEQVRSDWISRTGKQKGIVQDWHVKLVEDKRLAPEVVCAWFLECTMKIDKQKCRRINAPSRFYADQIAQSFGDLFSNCKICFEGKVLYDLQSTEEKENNKRQLRAQYGENIAAGVLRNSKGSENV